MIDRKCKWKLYWQKLFKQHQWDNSNTLSLIYTVYSWLQASSTHGDRAKHFAVYKEEHSVSVTLNFDVLHWVHRTIPTQHKSRLWLLQNPQFWWLELWNYFGTWISATVMWSIGNALSNWLLFEYVRPVIFANLLRLRNSWNIGHVKILGFTVPGNW